MADGIYIPLFSEIINPLTDLYETSLKEKQRLADIEDLRRASGGNQALFDRAVTQLNKDLAGLDRLQAADKKQRRDNEKKNTNTALTFALAAAAVGAGLYFGWRFFRK